MDKPKTEEQVIIFALKGEKYGLSIRNLISVSDPNELKSEGKKDRYAGKLVVRSQEVPVISLNMLLQRGEGDLSDNTKIVVLGSSGKMVGLMVDEVLEVITYSLKSVKPLPKTIMDNSITFFLGIGRVNNEPILFLNETGIIASSYSGKT
ncbi:MAG: chemotaxis protein CheW [Nitrospirae bacterium]|nr:chemotaxis protein CheW [Nitrospirota bacterium]